MRLHNQENQERITFIVNREMKQAMKIMAKKNKKTIGAILRNLIDSYLNQEKSVQINALKNEIELLRKL